MSDQRLHHDGWNVIINVTKDGGYHCADANNPIVYVCCGKKTDDRFLNGKGWLTIPMIGPRDEWAGIALSKRHGWFEWQMTGAIIQYSRDDVWDCVQRDLRRFIQTELPEEIFNRFEQRIDDLLTQTLNRAKEIIKEKSI